MLNKHKNFFSELAYDFEQFNKLKSLLAHEKNQLSLIKSSAFD